VIPLARTGSSVRYVVPASAALATAQLFRQLEGGALSNVVRDWSMSDACAPLLACCTWRVLTGVGSAGGGVSQGNGRIALKPQFERGKHERETIGFSLLLDFFCTVVVFERFLVPWIAKR
jgi:hypothetical protein